MTPAEAERKLVKLWKDYTHDRRGDGGGPFACRCFWTCSRHGEHCPEHGRPDVVVPNPAESLIAARDEMQAERDRLFVELADRTAERDSLRERLAVARVDPAKFWPEALRELIEVSRSAARMLEAIDRVELGLGRWLLKQHASTCGGAASGETDLATTTRNP